MIYNIKPKYLSMNLLPRSLHLN